MAFYLCIVVEFLNEVLADPFKVLMSDADEVVAVDEDVCHEILYH